MTISEIVEYFKQQSEEYNRKADAGVSSVSNYAFGKAYRDAAKKIEDECFNVQTKYAITLVVDIDGYPSEEDYIVRANGKKTAIEKAQAQCGKENKVKSVIEL